MGMGKASSDPQPALIFYSRHGHGAAPGFRFSAAWRLAWGVPQFMDGLGL
jgi:hypothetical protein